MKFRVVVIDDDEIVAPREEGKPWPVPNFRGDLVFVKEFEKPEMQKHSKVIFCKDADLTSRLDLEGRPVDGEAKNADGDPVESTAEEFLSRASVIVLDIRGVGANSSPRDPSLAMMENFRDLGLEPPAPRAWGNYDGLKFFHAHYRDISAACLIVVLTMWADGEGVEMEPLLHPFTAPPSGYRGPHVVKFTKRKDSGSLIRDLILDHFDFWKTGLTDAVNRPEILFASKTDLPVMIIGETGTGKEAIARFIHKQWARRIIREGRPFSDRGDFVVVNCGGLTEELARAELFGSVKGAFTGSTVHQLGKIFRAAGVRTFKQGGDFGEQLVLSAGGIVERVPDSPDLKANLVDDDDRSLPIGTLFLDEFGDLPPRAQTLLLRFLEDRTREAAPVGYLGVITGLSVRLIVATSDPRVAVFAGVEDFCGEERESPGVRSDVLHRVRRGPVIRAQPVTVDNIDVTLRGLIAGHPRRLRQNDSENVVVEWDTEAISYVKESIFPSQATVRRSFGHRRELSGLVDLVYQYAASAKKRGVRDRDLDDSNSTLMKVKRGLIKRLWRPAEFPAPAIVGLGPDAAPLAPNPVVAVTVESAVTVDGVRSAFVASLKRAYPEFSLPDDWTWERDIKDNPHLRGERREAVHDCVLEAFKGKNADSRLAEIACVALHGPGHQGKARSLTYFSKTFRNAR